jgi:hypothetical protein
VSGAGKLRGRVAFDEFARMLAGVRSLPRSTHRPVAAALVAGELAVPVSLLLRPAAGLLLATSLLVSFSTFIAVTMHRGTAMTCHCFGTRGTPLGRAHLVRNALLVGVAVAGLWAAPGGTAAPLEAAGVALAVISAAIAAWLLIRFDELAELFTT